MTSKISTLSQYKILSPKKLILPFYLFSLGFSSLGASADLGMKTNELQIALSDPKLGTVITLIGWLTLHVEIY